MKRLVFLLLFLVAASSSFAKDIKTIVVTTRPQMHCTNCETKIKKNLRFEKGVKKIETNIEKQTVTIVYDADKTSEDAILKGFSKFGYTARVLKDGETVETDEEEACPNM
ncbi:MAG: heavy-metal-associated domain-containing protein [Bacteroidaceae bacterium]|nr:heavy-metal-associated domain-containing protein [Bacteroidaceae bacterium]